MSGTFSLAATLAWRFRSNKHENGFVSFISASSTIGIGLGCFVLILLLSVMNGFEKELTGRLLSVIPHGEIWSVDNEGLQGWQQTQAQLTARSDVVNVSPFVKATGMLQKGNQMKALELQGLEPEFAAKTTLVQRLSAAHWNMFNQNTSGIVLGKGVLDSLKLEVGDRVQLLLPTLTSDLSLKPPKTITLDVVGHVSIGGELDNHVAFVHMETLANVLGVTHGAQGLRMKFTDPFIAPATTRDIGFSFDQYVYISDWTRTQGHLYQDIQLVRTVVYIALTLVIAVACFNIVSTLVMEVKEKQGEIAILKTMGCQDGMIITVFVIQGMFNGVIGVSVGVLLGVLASLNLTEAVLWLEDLFGMKVLSGDIYFIDFLPTHLSSTEVVLTAVIALTLAFLATLFPARQAAKLHPAQALGQ